MSTWRVVSGEVELAIEVAIDGEMSLDTVPSGGTFTGDVQVMEEVRSLLAAAINIAQSRRMQ